MDRETLVLAEPSRGIPVHACQGIRRNTFFSLGGVRHVREEGRHGESDSTASLSNDAEAVNRLFHIFSEFPKYLLGSNSTRDGPLIWIPSIFRVLNLSVPSDVHPLPFHPPGVAM